MRMMADRGNDDRAVRPLPVFNGTMNGPSKMGNDDDSYAVWRVRLVINLRAKRLLPIVAGNDDDEDSDDSDDDEIQPSVQRRQARAAHIMTSSLGTDLFLFVQGVNNDPAAILRILDTQYQGTDTSSIMSAVNEFITKKYRPGQHMEMFFAEFEGLSMRLEAIGHDVSERMRVVNFLKSLFEVSALSAVLSALRVIDNLSWTKETSQILLELDIKGVKNNGPERSELAMVANNGFTATCYICGKVGHRSSDHIDRGRHQSRHPMRRYGRHGGGHHAHCRRGDHHNDHRQGHGGARPGGARQGGAGLEEGFHGRDRQGGDQHRVQFSNDGNDDWRLARAAPAIGYHHRDQFNHKNSSSDDDQFDRAASAIVAAHHVGNKLHSQTVVVDSGATRHMFYDLSVFHKLESIAPTIVKLGDDSTANCTQIGEIVLHMSDGRSLRLSQVIYVPRLAINLLRVSQLAKEGIMKSFTKTECALIDSDDGNCLLTEASITPGVLYNITKAVRRASLAARSLSLLLRHHRLRRV
jgi:gag-polypeptide of LTR copia-type